MEYERINWQEPAIIYVLAIDKFIKFGMTNNWERRKEEYLEQTASYSFQKIKEYNFQERWQAELIEQVVKWRLRRWVEPGLHEYINLPLQAVIDCISQTLEEIEPEIAKHKYIYSQAEKRWDFYKQIAAYYFKAEEGM